MQMEPNLISIGKPIRTLRPLHIVIGKEQSLNSRLAHTSN